MSSPVTAPSPTPGSPRPESGEEYRRWTARLGWVLAVAVPAWLAGGRVLTDSTGNLTPVYAATLAPVLLVLSVVALAVPARRPARYPSTRACTVLQISWACGIALGFTLPDTGEGASSVLGAWAGSDAEGVAAALSNPLGIIMLFMAIMGCVLSIRHSAHGEGNGRRSRDADEDDAQGTGFFPVLDV
ncbi:hypothetical protein [Citricoccus alkalitolerans]|uniref:DNA translocase FtsK 4TM region domain-containing protein n=1 Tax=Citricoccus alkalitolerans TaxID=246603 RepID=A0ABV8XX01_9MICC